MRKLVPVAAASATTPTRAATAKISLDHWFRFIDRQSSTVEIGTAQPRDRLIGVFFAHLHKTETFRTASIAIGDNSHRFNGPESCAPRISLSVV